MVMSHEMHHQTEIVQRAIAVFRSEANASEVAELEDEQLAAGSSGLEWYGRTAGVFERYLAAHSIGDEARKTLESAIRAVRVLFGSVT
jgi:hypothetical protein